MDKRSVTKNWGLQTVHLSSDIEKKTYNLIGIDDDPKALQQEIFEIPMIVDILITDDF